LNNDLTIGMHRPVYLWAGSGTVRMNHLKFMGAPVDEHVHAEAHTAVGAQRILKEAGFNWAYLTYDWGFPPEIEQEDWEDFHRAVQVYHDVGVRVFGYVQTSNCVYAGSYCDKDWYAADPQGWPFYYYTGRYMTCWQHPEWIAHLKDIVRGIIEAEADGVFFDNPWHAAQPIHFGGAWMGPAGCYCARCQAAFQKTCRLDIPTHITPQTNEASRLYIRWRTEQVTQTLSTLASYARSLKPNIFISANDFDAVMRPSFLIYGIDLGSLAKVQDVIMIEDYGLPRWEEKDGLLVNNALTLRTARALVGDTPLSTDPYDKGIGFDGVYTPRRLQQGIAEAAACSAMMVVKGTEYIEEGAFTLLTAKRFAPQREAVGVMHRWLEQHADLYQDRQNAARVGILYPGDALWQTWDQIAPLYFGVGQTLLAANIPWRVVTLKDDWGGLDTLFCFNSVTPKQPARPDVRIIDVSKLPGWTLPPSSFLARHARAHALASELTGWLYRAYFEKRWARQLGDRLGLAHFFLQSPYFRLPSEAARNALLATLDELPYPRIASSAPVLVELWQQEKRQQLHLVNYATEPQIVTVTFAHPMSGKIMSPEGGELAIIDGACVDVNLDVYAVIELADTDKHG